MVQFKNTIFQNKLKIKTSEIMNTSKSIVHNTLTRTRFWLRVESHNNVKTKYYFYLLFFS